MKKHLTKADKLLYALEAAPFGLTAKEVMAVVNYSSTAEFYANVQVARLKAIREGYIIDHIQGPRMGGGFGRAAGRYVLTKYNRVTAK